MKAFKFACGQIVQVLLSYVFVGIAAGLLLREAGYSPVWAFLSGIFIYAGSMQIVLVGLMSGGTPLYQVAILTLFINARHIFYGIGFIREFKTIGAEKHGFWKYPYMALTVTDETYSLLCALECPEGLDRGKVEFDILFLCHMLWILSCTAGSILGGLLPFGTAGIEFSATAFFTVVVIDQWHRFGSKIPVFTGLVSALIFRLLLGENFILPALSLSLIVLMVMRDKISLQMRKGDCA